jgi:hypothetical protein
LRSLALSVRKIAMTSRPLMSRECAYVAGWHARNAETNRAVTRKCAKNEEGRLITGPRLLISGSKVRVLDGPPIKAGASEVIPRRPFCTCRRHVDACELAEAVARGVMSEKLIPCSGCAVVIAQQPTQPLPAPNVTARECAGLWSNQVVAEPLDGSAPYGSAPRIRRVHVAGAVPQRESADQDTPRGLSARTFPRKRWPSALEWASGRRDPHRLWASLGLVGSNFPG